MAQPTRESTLRLDPIKRKLITRQRDLAPFRLRLNMKRPPTEGWVEEGNDGTIVNWNTKSEAAYWGNVRIPLGSS